MENFTIVGNSLGDMEWSGYIPVTTTADNGSVIETGQFGFNNGSWYTGFGAAGKWEGLSQDACPNFREDLEAYLSTAGSNSKSLLVSTIKLLDACASSAECTDWWPVCSALQWAPLQADIFCLTC